MTEIDAIFLKLDHLISISRLNELALMLQTDRAYRVVRMMTVLKELKPGAYLLGTGPTTSAIIPLTVDEVVLGRTATPVEKPAEAVIDYAVADMMYFGPREVSRVHAKIVRQPVDSGFEYRLVDLASTSGTYLNGRKVSDTGEVLSHGDVLSLGPSEVSTYLFYVVPAPSPTNESGEP